ncbi:MAG: hypothetical protein ACLTMP_06720 [Eggerthella lenta]
MTIWQVWLRRLCLFVIVWAIAEVLLGAALWGAYLFARMVLDVEPSVLAEPVVGAMAIGGAMPQPGHRIPRPSRSSNHARSPCSSGSRSSMRC